MNPFQIIRRLGILASLAVFPLAVGASDEQAHQAKPACTKGGKKNAALAVIAARGDFAMRVGQNTEAIATFEKVLQADPGFKAVWGKLAYLYLKEGESAKAVEAFKKAKLLSDANGGIVTRNGLRGIWLP